MTPDERRQQVIDQELSKGTRQRAINAMCAYCIFDPSSGTGTWKEQVMACTAHQCPIFDFRPIPRDYHREGGKIVYRPPAHGKHTHEEAS